MVGRLHLFSFGIAAGLALGLTSCSGISTVKDIQNNPHRNWFNSTVYLRGQVSDRVPLLDAQVYQLQDATGKIWVLTDQTTPKQGDAVYIKGTVKFESMPLEGQEFGEAYIQEQEQLDPKENP
jgi:hypothetical protein